MPSLARKLQSALDADKPHGSPGYDGRRPIGRASHPVDTMKARGSISDQEYLAALRFRTDYDLAFTEGAGGVVDFSRMEMFAVDYDKELAGRHRSEKRVTRVPSGPARLIDSKRDLAMAKVAVGPLGFQILRGVVVMGIPIVAIAKELGIHRDYVSFRMHEALESLIEFYGVEGAS